MTKRITWERLKAFQLPRDFHNFPTIVGLGSLTVLKMLAPKLQLNSPLSNPPVGKTPTYRPEEVPSCGGHGTYEMLEVTRFLEHHGIECCLVGVSALIFYGAGRVRNV